jgi:hypothetical protein
LKQILRSLPADKEAANNKEAAVSAIIQVLIVLACAYAGSTVAGAQFSELREAAQMANEYLITENSDRLR